VVYRAFCRFTKMNSIFRGARHSTGLVAKGNGFPPGISCSHADPDALRQSLAAKSVRRAEPPIDAVKAQEAVSTERCQQRSAQGPAAAFRQSEVTSLELQLCNEQPRSVSVSQAASCVWRGTRRGDHAVVTEYHDAVSRRIECCCNFLFTLVRGVQIKP
jgi:hypothetical protein